MGSAAREQLGRLVALHGASNGLLLTGTHGDSTAIEPHDWPETPEDCGVCDALDRQRTVGRGLESPVTVSQANREILNHPHRGRGK